MPHLKNTVIGAIAGRVTSGLFTCLLVSCGQSGGSSGNAQGLSSATNSILPQVAGAMSGPKSSTAVASTSSLATSSSSGAPPAATIAAFATPPPPPVQVHLTYQLPLVGQSAQTTMRRMLVTKSVGYRSLQYISTANTQLTVGVTPLGGSTTNATTSCTTASCSVTFTATPGPTTLSFTFKDGSGTVLSQFSTLAIIQPSTINTLSFSANPVVSSVSLSLASSAINAGGQNSVALTVNALDADGNTIIGNSSYVDVNGNPVTISLNVANVQAGGKGTVTIQGANQIFSPNHAAIYAHYDGNWLQSAVISACCLNKKCYPADSCHCLCPVLELPKSSLTNLAGFRRLLAAPQYQSRPPVGCRVAV